jgi:hypothetical protein
LKLQCDETLSNFPFNFNLRRYSVAAVAVADRNLFRKDRLYTPEVGARGHLNPNPKP